MTVFAWACSLNFVGWVWFIECRNLELSWEMFFVLCNERNHAFFKLLLRCQSSIAIVKTVSLLEIGSLPLILHRLRFCAVVVTIIGNDTRTWRMALIQNDFSKSWVNLGVLRPTVNSTHWLILKRWLCGHFICGLVYHSTVVVASIMTHHFVQILCLFSLSMAVRSVFYLLLTCIVFINDVWLFLTFVVLLRDNF
jgi:hypothetical protein